MVHGSKGNLLHFSFKSNLRCFRDHPWIWHSDGYGGAVSGKKEITFSKVSKLVLGKGDTHFGLFFRSL